MGIIGKFLLIFGLAAMTILFALSLVLYMKDKRMELSVMGFALAMALTVSGVTVTMHDRAEARRTAFAAAETARTAQSAQATAAVTNETWFSQPDGTYLHADGTTAGESQTDVSASLSGPASAQPELPQSAPVPGASDASPQDAPEASIPA